MTKETVKQRRERIATAALIGMLASDRVVTYFRDDHQQSTGDVAQELARIARINADALIKELDK